MGDEKRTILPLKYRPKDFSEVWGNEATLEALRVTLERGEGLPHAILLTGPSGCGKTTIARIIGNKLGCHPTCFFEYNTANARKIEDVREIIRSCRLAPMSGKVKVYLLDECHQLTKDAQEALLKVLEDAPDHAYFILCTTNPEKLKKTIKTRCAKHSVSELSPKIIVKHLKRVVYDEGFDEFPGTILKEVAKACLGSPREALSILDAVIDIEDEDTAIRAIQSGAGNDSTVIDLCRHILNGKGKNKWKVCSSILQELEGESETHRRIILSYMEKVLLSDGDPRVAQIMECFFFNTFDTGRPGLTQMCYMAIHV